jgi:epoxyqueuosine reductase
MKTLNDELKTLLISTGASLVGFANLEEIAAEVRDNFPFGVSIAVALNPRVMSEIKEGPTKAYVEECKRADNLLDELGQVAERFLRQKGHDAQPRTTPGAEYPETLSTKLPQKTIATRAGLGWIGKCALLVTKEFGPAVRLGSILTDAGLPSAKPIDTSQCRDCNACVGICPARAITGEEWHVGTERIALVDVFACRQTARELLTKRTGGQITGRTFCGLCIVACPWTKKYLERAA